MPISLQLSNPAWGDQARCGVLSKVGWLNATQLQLPAGVAAGLPQNVTVYSVPILVAGFNQFFVNLLYQPSGLGLALVEMTVTHLDPATGASLAEQAIDAYAPGPVGWFPYTFGAFSPGVAPATSGNVWHTIKLGLVARGGAGQLDEAIFFAVNR